MKCAILLNIENLHLEWNSELEKLQPTLLESIYRQTLSCWTIEQNGYLFYLSIFYYQLLWFCLKQSQFIFLVLEISLKALKHIHLILLIVPFNFRTFNFQQRSDSGEQIWSALHWDGYKCNCSQKEDHILSIDLLTILIQYSYYMSRK